MSDAQAVAASFVKAFNAHDEAKLREFTPADARMEAPGEVSVEGREPVMQYTMSWLRAFPDARVTVRHEHTAGDHVIQEFTFEGSHEDTLSGPGGDIPATQRKLRGRGVQVLRVRGNEIPETRLYFDQVEVLSQLGVMPQPAAA